MKKRNSLKYILIGAAAAALSLSACGKQDEAETTTAAETETQAETDAVSAMQAEIDALNDVARPASLGSVTLGNYTGIAITTEEPHTTTDADVDSYLNNYVLPAYLESTDDAVRDGDTVNIDYVGKKDGEAFAGGTAQGQDLVIGSQSYIDGFESGLVGYKKGDAVTLYLTFPENYGNEELAGQDVTFDVTINDVKRVPELTDGLAAEIDPNATTAAEYRENIRKMLQDNENYAAEQQLAYQALDQIVQNSEVEPTEEAVDWQIAQLITGYFVPMMQQSAGMGLADMLNLQGMSLDEFKEQLRESAEESVKQIMVMDEIAAEQNITAGEAEIEAWAAKNNTTLDELRAAASDEEIEAVVREQLANEYIIENAVITYESADAAAESTEAGSSEPASTEADE